MTTLVARPDPWAPLRHRTFRALYLAQFTSNVGTWMQTVGAQWLMGDLRGGTFAVALVQTATSLPIFALAVLAGALNVQLGPGARARVLHARVHGRPGARRALWGLLADAAGLETTMVTVTAGLVATGVLARTHPLRPLDLHTCPPWKFTSRPAPAARRGAPCARGTTTRAGSAARNAHTSGRSMRAGWSSVGGDGRCASSGVSTAPGIHRAHRWRRP